MSTDTTYELLEGHRVVYTGASKNETNESLIGKFGVITQNDGTTVLPFYVQFETDGNWWCNPADLIRVPEIGDTVIATEVPVVAEQNGKPCRVVSVDYNRHASNAVIVAGEFKSIQKPDDTEKWSFSEWTWPTGETVASSDQSDTITDLREQVERLTRERDEQTRLRALADERMTTYRDGIVAIGNGLLEEAERRSWCSEYDEFVEEMKNSLPDAVADLIPTREREFEVTWTDYVSVPVSRSVTVTARNEEQAEEAARNNDYLDTDDVIDAVRYGGWSCDDSSDYDVSEV